MVGSEGGFLFDLGDEATPFDWRDGTGVWVAGCHRRRRARNTQRRFEGLGRASGAGYRAVEEDRAFG